MSTAAYAKCLVAVLGAALVSCASIHSAPRTQDRWKIAEPVRRPVPSCAAVEPTVIRSENGAVDVSVRLEGGAARPCRVAITQASLRMPDRMSYAERVPLAPALTSAHTVHARVHFRMEGTSATQATLVLAMTVDGEPTADLAWPMTLEGP